MPASSDCDRGAGKWDLPQDLDELADKEDDNITIRARRKEESDLKNTMARYLVRTECIVSLVKVTLLLH
jgi:hypothetical protein